MTWRCNDEARFHAPAGGASDLKLTAMEKYLRQYAEPETFALDDFFDRFLDQAPWAHVLVIPACNEHPGFLLRSPPPGKGRSLMILVINESAAAAEKVSVRNRELAATVQGRFKLEWEFAQPPARKYATDCPGFKLSLWRDPLALRDVLLVDRFSPGCQLPAKGGVGHARKIGADLAAGFIHKKRILSPWIHCTDADVRLPETYFSCIEAAQLPEPGLSATHAALLYPFQHRADVARDRVGDEDEYTEESVLSATQLYELSLRYYVAGIKFAGSPYAFHTIGSTVTVHANAYAKVRGFPRREAGEDFYLLNKLAKVGPVLELGAGPGCVPIRIAARRSDRVPFGTGAAVNKITSLTDPIGDFRFYHPAVFELLRQWLQAWPAIWQSRCPVLPPDIFPGSKQDYWQDTYRVSLLAGLADIKAEEALVHAFRQSKNLEQFARQMHTWFDAFRTLKLIHSLRDRKLPSVSYATLAAHPMFGHLLSMDKDLLVYYQQFTAHRAQRAGHG